MKYPKERNLTIAALMSLEEALRNVAEAYLKEAAVCNPDPELGNPLPSLKDWVEDQLEADGVRDELHAAVLDYIQDDQVMTHDGAGLWD
jgi:hypothetical protein